MRKRMTKSEEKLLLEEIIPLYKDGYAPNLISKLLDRRMALIERLLLRYLENNEEEIKGANKFFAKKTKRISEICPNKNISNCFLAEFDKSGKIILIPFK